MSIGEGLAQARREAGLSLAQVSQRTRIREKIIADIESDDYSACGGDFYARGHIRSIARAVGTDPDPFIRQYDATQPEPDELAEAEITQPGLGIGTRPGIPVYAEPGPPMPAQPGIPVHGPPGPPAHPEPGPPMPDQPGIPVHAQPGPPVLTEPGPPVPAQPGPPTHTEPAWPVHADSGRAARGEPGRAARTEPAFPLFAEPAPADGARPAPPGGPRPLSPPAPPGERRRHSLPPAPVPPGRTRRRRPLNWAAPLALVLLAGIGYLAYSIFGGSSQATNSAHSAPARPATSQSAVPSSPAPTQAPTQAPTSSPSPKPTPRARPLAPAGAQALGVGGQGDNTANAHLAIDGHPGTAWHTDWYTTAAFGNLYAGTGLLVDMGRPVTIMSARIRFGPGHGGSFQLRVGHGPSLAGLRPVAHGIAAGVTRLRLASPARGRYVLIWLTRLPVEPSGTYRASVYDVRLRGR